LSSSLLSLFALAGPDLEVRFAAEGPRGSSPAAPQPSILAIRWRHSAGALRRADAQRARAPQAAAAVYLAELDLARLYALPLKRSTARELSRFQAVERDFSFTFPTHTLGHHCHGARRSCDPRARALEPRGDLPRRQGQGGSAEHYALLVRCVFQSHERTLREEDLTAWSAKIMETLSGLAACFAAKRDSARRCAAV